MAIHPLNLSRFAVGTARFYSAGVILAFEHMHQRRIIYRDLKPENLLLTEDGQLKVTDMGHLVRMGAGRLARFGADLSGVASRSR